MAYGKSIELFLANGTAESLIAAELSNWNGKAIKIPRNEVNECKRDDIKGVGIYFLLCSKEYMPNHLLRPLGYKKMEITLLKIVPDVYSSITLIYPKIKRGTP